MIADSAKTSSSRTVLICHDTEQLNQRALARWLASFTDLAAVVVICEPKSRLWKRVKREVKRIGLGRFLDVLAFRLYSRLFLSASDRRWTEDKLQQLEARYPEISQSTRILM